MEKLRLGLIGLGQVASHYENILRDNSLSDFVEISLGVDPIDEVRKKWQGRVKKYLMEDISHIDPNELDLALVLTPSGLHEEDSFRLLEKGINVLCEKPIGLNIEKVRDNIKLAKRKNIAYGGVFQNRFNKPVLLIKKLIDQGVFGKIISSSVRLQWCRLQDYYNDGWHGKWALDGGVINQQAIHHIDTLFYLLGAPKKAIGFSGNLNNSLEAEDTFVGSGQLESGGFFTLEATTAIRPHDIKASIEIMGDQAQASIGGVALNNLEYLQIGGKDAEEDILVKNSEDVENGYGNGHKFMLRLIVDTWIKEKKIKLPITARESLKVVKYIHALYSSVEEGKIINFDEEVKSKRLGIKDV